MYPGIRRYRVTWAHEKLSLAYGLLKLHTVEKYVSLDSDKTIIEDIDQIVYKPDFDDEERDFHREITFEYVLLPKGEVWIPDDLTLRDLREMGYAWWHETFNLILLFHSSAVQLNENHKETETGTMLWQLDKMKFTEVIEPVFGYTNPWGPPPWGLLKPIKE